MSLGCDIFSAPQPYEATSELCNDSRREAKIDLVGWVTFKQDGIKIGSVKLVRINTGVEVVQLSQPHGKLPEDFEIGTAAERHRKIIGSYGSVRDRRRDACEGARIQGGSIPADQGMYEGSES